jgi:hypothetical protein
LCGYVVFSALHALPHSLQRPSGIIAECPRSEFGGLFDANAAVTEITAGAREQIGRRRAVKIDVVLVRENQLDQTERVGRAGLLPHHQLSGPQLRQYIVGNIT